MRGIGQSGDYELYAPPQPDRAEIRFQGRFQGRLVTWHAVVLTLERYHREHCGEDQPRRSDPARLRPFIDVAAAHGHTPQPHVTVGLDVARIDRPTLLKCVIMLRQYKGLRVGRHEFGAARSFSPAHR
ncbi:MAG: hypothetical protein P8076_06385 [Gammaproteobacteria bacterium]